MRSATLFVLFGAILAVNGCGSSSNLTGTAGTSGGGAGTGGGTAGTSGGGAGTGGGTAGTSGGGAGTGGSGGDSAGSGGTAGRGGGSGSGGAGGAPSGCGTETGTGSGPTCSTIAAAGPCVTPQVVAGTPATASGGPVSPGTYNLTSASIFHAQDGGAVPLNSGRRTLSIGTVTAGMFSLDQVSVSGTRTDRSSGTVVITGTTATFTRICPPVGDGGDAGGSVGFTATSTSLTLIDSSSGDGSVEVDVYTK